MSWATVAALTVGVLPDRQEFWICLDPACPVVYFGSQGERIESDGMKLVPGFKRGSDGLICYCFLHRRSEVEAELREKGSTGVVQRIGEKIAAGRCACEVRNPEGKCCLGSVKRIVSALEQGRK